MLRRPAGRDREPGYVEVAVVGNSWSVCGDRRRGASVHRDETGNREGTSAGRSSRSSRRVDEDIRPTGIRVRRNSNVRGRSPEGDPPLGPFGRKAAPLRCVDFVCHGSVVVLFGH